MSDFTVKTIKTNCNKCSGDTNHLVLFSKIEVEEDENSKDEFNHMVVQCAGCDEISFVMRWTLSILPDPEIDHYDFNYPEVDWSDFNFLDSEFELPLLPKEISNLYDEVENAFVYECEVLAGIGLRTLIEAVCIQQGILGRNLKVKIGNLLNKGLISHKELPILDKLREIGNASAHEIEKISLTKLEHALEIINHLLRSIYVLPHHDKKLSKHLERKQRSKKLLTRIK